LKGIILDENIPARLTFTPSLPVIHSSILVSDEDWRAIQESLYLVSIPGMRESIRKGLKTPAKRLSKKLNG